MKSKRERPMVCNLEIWAYQLLLHCSHWSHVQDAWNSAKHQSLFVVVAPGRSLVPSYTTSVAHESHRTLVAKKKLNEWPSLTGCITESQVKIVAKRALVCACPLGMPLLSSTLRINEKTTISTWGLPKKNLPSLHFQSWTSWKKLQPFNLAKLRCAYLWEMLRVDATSRAGWKQCCDAAIGFHCSTVQLYLPHKALVSVSRQHFTLMSVNLCFTTFQAAQLLSSYTTFHSPKTAAEMLEAMKSIVLYFIILQCL